MLVGREAVALDPDNSDAWLAISLAAAGIDDFAQSFEAAEKALAGDPEHPQNYLGTLWYAASSAGNFERALEAADSLLVIDDSDASSHTYRAIALASLQRIDEAMVAADRAYTLDPSSTRILRARSSIAARSGDLEKAKESFEVWTSRDPEAGEAWIGFASIYAQENEWEQAVGAFRGGVALVPDNESARGWLAGALIEVGEISEALDIFSGLSKAFPDNEEIWLGKSAAERLMGLSAESVASGLMALQTGSFKSSEAWVQLAHAYSSDGRHDNAWRAFERASTLDPDSEEAALGVAVESLRCHNEGRALRELRAAEDRIGADGIIEFNRGVAYYRLGKEALAAEAWRRARDLDPDLGATDFLINSVSTNANAGSWAEYWFGKPVGRWRKIGGSFLILLLVASLALPFLKPHLLPGLVTGRLSLQAFLPSVILGLLLVLPTIRGLAVGGVSLDVSPIAPEQDVRLDPSQVLPPSSGKRLM